MRVSRITALGSLFIAAAAQDVVKNLEQQLAVLHDEGVVVSSDYFSMTVFNVTPPYTVYTCGYAAASFSEGWLRQEECTSISTVTNFTSSSNLWSFLPVEH